LHANAKILHWLSFGKSLSVCCHMKAVIGTVKGSRRASLRGRWCLCSVCCPRAVSVTVAYLEGQRVCHSKFRRRTVAHSNVWIAAELTERYIA
jgi:hypothetical protein